MFVVPAWTKMRRQDHRDNCVSNLAKVSRAYRSFAEDHDGKFPWEVPESGGGITLPPRGVTPAPNQNVFSVFTRLTNELKSPSVLVCPSDKRKIRQDSWEWCLAQGVDAAKIPSYFVGPSAHKQFPRSILGGDRSLSVSSLGLDFQTSNNYNRLVQLQKPANRGDIHWTEGRLHGGGGNLMLGDGSVLMLSSARAEECFVNAWTESKTNIDLFYPAL